MNNPNQKTAAEAKKDVYQTTTDGEGSEEYKKYLKTYINLRTALDSLQAVGLRWVLKAETLGERTKRAEEVEAQVKSVMAEIPNAVPSEEGGCGDGYYNCGGVCVPYPCPIETLE